MITWITAYAAAAVAFLVLDLVWLGVVARTFYRDRLGGLLRDDVDVVPALLFYLLYVLGIVVFAVAPALAAGSWMTAALYGALLGLVAYATYDLTNLATLAGWPLSVAVVDMLWGAAVTALAATLGMLAARALA